MASNSTPHKLHILFFPFMAPGHVIPMLDMTKLFALHGVRTTFITTPANALLVQPTINRANSANSTAPQINLTLLPFPSAEVGLPSGCENAASIQSSDMRTNFFKAVMMLRQPFDQVLKELHPDAIVTDSFLPWTFDAASKFGIPRLVFNGTSFFASCVRHSVDEYKPHERPEESFTVPGLPHPIHMLKSQFLNYQKANPLFTEFFRTVKESDAKSYGQVMNSFYELEPEYVDHYRNVMCRRAWCVGPVSLYNEEVVDMSGRGGEVVIDQDECLDWLDNKQQNSVLYVYFGSVGTFTPAQLHEIALGLESSQQPFIWVVKKLFDDETEWLPEGYEESLEGRGLIIRGWAPQMLILNHEAVGGFLTHCGWNSALEAVCAGVPMVTMPMLADQFPNERLLVDVLKIGVGIGVKEFGTGQKFGMGAENVSALVRGEDIEKAVARLMNAGEEAERMRRRARELRESAKMALEKGGSSSVAICDLIRELTEKLQTPL